jgi:hypothetical protein
MARFIHLAPEPLAKRVWRSGIRPTRIGDWFARSGIRGLDRAVWAFPVMPSFTLSHQWLRELKRKGARTLVAVTFRIEDDELVLARHYRQKPQPMTAAEAIGAILAQPEPLGYEVMVPRRIKPSEIVAVRSVPQKVGWRTIPDRKRMTIIGCTCPMCIPPGTVKSAQRRAKLERRNVSPLERLLDQDPTLGLGVPATDR